jgi:DNA-binding transcriptional regulator YiaG
MARAVLTTKKGPELWLDTFRAESRANAVAELRAHEAKLRKMEFTQGSWTAFVMLAVHAGLTTAVLSDGLGVTKREVRRWRRGERTARSQQEAQAFVNWVLDTLLK